MAKDIRTTKTPGVTYAKTYAKKITQFKNGPINQKVSKGLK
jgi:hypothetical protein